jgi:hypothetical protein
MIHCDEVFDILTRGPFPTGAPSDGIVESHLGHCDECRRLADALRPALELLQEAVTPEESRTLPCYGGSSASELEPWNHATAGDSSKTLVATRRPVVRRPAVLVARAWPWASSARFVAAALVGLVLAGVLRHVGTSGGMLSAGRAKAAAWREADDGDDWFRKQNLPADCRQPLTGLTLLAAAPRAEPSIELTCCLGCHSAVDQKLYASTAVGRFVQACQACH